MALPTVNIMPLDPNLKTGPSRIISGATRFGVITPGTAYGEFATWIYVGGAGDISVQCWDGTNVTFKATSAGVIYPIASIMVNSAGTTATNLVWGS